MIVRFKTQRPVKRDNPVEVPPAPTDRKQSEGFRREADRRDIHRYDDERHKRDFFEPSKEGFRERDREVMPPSPEPEPPLRFNDGELSRFL